MQRSCDMRWQAHISANLPTIHCNQQSEMEMTKGVSSCRGEGRGLGTKMDLTAAVFV